MEFKHAYSESCRSSDLECLDPSLAQQQFAEDADINVMLERFKVTGQLPVSATQAVFGDFTQVGDFRTAMEKLRVAQESFMGIPFEIRQQFGNNPALFSDFCLNKDNLPKLREWGLAPRPPEPPSKPAEAS